MPDATAPDSVDRPAAEPARHLTLTNVSALWLLAVGCVVVSGLLLLTVHRHRDDVAFTTLGGGACRAAAECERLVTVPALDDDGELTADGFTFEAIECRASERGLGLFCRDALEEVHGYRTDAVWSPLFNPVDANQIIPWTTLAAAPLTVGALGHTYVMRRGDRRRGASRSSDGTGWYRGTRRVGGVLEVRDRWQGLFGQNAWLTILLAFAAIVSPPLIAALCLASLVFVALRFYPVVEFGPTRIRWRNWFRLKEVATADVRRFTVEAYPNPRAWIPAITADVEGRAWRSTPRFVATFSYRRRRAEAVAAAVRAWADDHSIPSELEPRRMVWRLREPAD